MSVPRSWSMIAIDGRLSAAGLRVTARGVVRLTFLVALIPCVLAGCAGSMDKRVTLRPEAARVELVTSHPEACQSLGDVVGSASVEGNQQQATVEARNDVRNKADALGATHVELQTSSNERKGGVWTARSEVTLVGVAYRCAK
jgi:hypothetical protein